MPDPISDGVKDFAVLLPAEAEARLIEVVKSRRSQTGVQVVVVTMNRIADYGGADQRIEDYAKALFNKWGVGDAERDDGILILVAREDREMRIALGSGYPVIWDNAAQRVIDRHMLPAFGEDRYADGLIEGASASFELIAGPYLDGEAPPEAHSRWDDILPIAIFAVIAAAMIGIFKRRAISDLALRWKPCPKCGAKNLSIRREVLRHSTEDSSGEGRAHKRCASCGWHSLEICSMPRKSSGSSSGGFGGDSPSGGGATGRW